MIRKLHRLSRFLRPLLVATAAVAVTATAQAQTTLRFGFGLPVDAHYGVGAAYMQKAVAERMGGRYKLELFPNFQLGGEREMTEGVQLGTIDLVTTSTGPVGNFAPNWYCARRPMAGPASTLSPTVSAVNPAGAMIWTSPASSAARVVTPSTPPK